MMIFHGLRTLRMASLDPSRFLNNPSGVEYTTHLQHPRPPHPSLTTTPTRASCPAVGTASTTWHPKQTPTRLRTSTPTK